MKITSLKNLEKYFGNEHREKNDFKLDYLKQFLTLEKNPEKKFPFIIHIAGTNGKGSTLAMLETLFNSHGFKTGMLTSPHLTSYTERFRIDKKPISEDTLLKEINTIHKKSQKYKIPLTLFEALLIASISIFRNEKIDIFLVETGLGGRLDSTNVLTSNISIISPIDFDHMDFLGDTIEKIAAEKAGIIKKNSITITNNTNISLEIIKKYVKKQNAKLVTTKNPKNISVSLSGTSFEYKENRYKTNLIGTHQAENSALALEVFFQTAQKIKPKKTISTKSINTALQQTIWPGRFQPVRNNPPIILDGAHNPHSIDALINTVEEIELKNLTIYFSAKKGKNIKENFTKLQKIAHEIIPVTSNAFMMATKTELEKETRTKTITPEQMLRRIEETHNPVLITGSLYFLGEFLELSNFHFPFSQEQQFSL